jgi:hypothetical protein
MPGLRREFQNNDRLATHTALGELFIPDAWQVAQGGVYRVESQQGEGLAERRAYVGTGQADFINSPIVSVNPFSSFCVPRGVKS